LAKTENGGFAPHYKIGDLGIVPHNKHIMSNYEKMQIVQPIRELGALKKVTRKSVYTQTIDETKVPMTTIKADAIIPHLFCFAKASVFSKIDFGYENTFEKSMESHPFYETKPVKPSKTAVLHPITAHNRVTDKVF
jgi:hypothetical protein